MFSLALIPDSAIPAASREDCDAAATQSEIDGLLSNLCSALQASGTLRFDVRGFDTAPWPVSVEYDLLVVLEQVPIVLRALRTPECREFELSFYEQGIERDLLFTREDNGHLVIDAVSALDWNPQCTVENSSVVDLEQQLLTLVLDFTEAAHQICPQAARSPVLTAWLSEMGIGDGYEPGSVVQLSTHSGTNIRTHLSAAAAQHGRVQDMMLENALLAGIDLCGLQASALNLNYVDLRGARLRDTEFWFCKFDEALLEDVDASFAELKKCTLDGAYATRIRLDGAHGEDSTASGVELRDASIREARLGACRFNGAVLKDSDWSKSTLRMCVLDNVSATGVRFDDVCLEDCSVIGADLRGASLRNARLSETRFERAVLCDAVFDGASGDGMVFRGADLSGASFASVQFEDADFRGADLRGANLSGGGFHNADFRGAILDGACFEGADFTGAYFDKGAGSNASPESRAGKESPKVSDEFAAEELRKAFTSLQQLLGSPGSPSAVLLERMQRTITSLHSAEEPPEEWKPLLEPLMKVTQGDQSLDLQAAVNALFASLKQDSPLDKDESKGS